MSRANYISRAAAIAAVYALWTYLLKPISYGPTQFRVSEIMTLLPLIESASVPGLFVGCFIANIFGGLGPWDIFGGSLITLLAAYVTSRTKNPFLGSLPPILFNALGVSLYISFIYGIPYWITALYIGLEQSAVILLIGLPLFFTLKNKGLMKVFRKD